jgi:hypothetical protein
MYLLYGVLILAMVFFFVLPITDARTARMKLSVVSSLGVLLAVSVVVPRLLHYRRICPPRRAMTGAFPRAGGWLTRTGARHDYRNRQYFSARGRFRRPAPRVPGAMSSAPAMSRAASRMTCISTARTRCGCSSSSNGPTRRRCARISPSKVRRRLSDRSRGGSSRHRGRRSIAPRRYRDKETAAPCTEDGC